VTGKGKSAVSRGIEFLREEITLFFKWIFFWVKTNPKKSFVCVFLSVGFYFVLPDELFDDPYSVVVVSEDGYLLGAKIADDGQWRFPPQDSVPYKFKTALLAFEDRHFYEHPGINPVSIWNAFVDNVSEGKIVRGGSTLTQQVIRLARKGKKRNYFEKFIEMVWATRLEFRYSKDEILSLYASHAPFGGNVVGIEMAAWRYFGLRPDQLSWAEATTLAVLPNAPSLIYPGKNQEKLLKKRNKVLKYLYENATIDEITYELAISEPLPEKPYALPQIAPHLVERVAKESKTPRFHSTIKMNLQERVNEIATNYYNAYKQNEVHNLAIIAIDVETRNVLSYVANSPTDEHHGKDVDIIVAPRSTGSILKPFLYAEMLSNGVLLPSTLVEDIPTQISGYTPQNYNSTFDGAVPAWKALARSLNIPAVLMLQKYGVNNFYEDLKYYGLKHVNKHPSHYGLSLILGGAESSLWDLCAAYAGYVGTLNHFLHEHERYRKNEFAPLNLSASFKTDFGKLSHDPTKVDASSIFLTFQALQEVNRPSEDEAWRYYSSSNKIAWKTGTSFGNRDAWAIGMSSKYVVGVWVGNASGEGRPELTGVGYASPILFDVFNLLPKSDWFKRPERGMMLSEICTQSGHLAGTYCEKEQKWISLRGEETDVCPYHKLIQLDATRTFRVNSNCEQTQNMVSTPWFSLPPVMEFYYKGKNPNYRTLPPFRSDCQEFAGKTIEFIYPANNSSIYLAKNFNGEIQATTIKVAHSQSGAELFWYLDNDYLGSTTVFHEMSISPKAGEHLITVVDQNGNEAYRRVVFKE